VSTRAGKPTVKQHLAAIRQLFDYLTTGGILRRYASCSTQFKVLLSLGCVTRRLSEQ
jgi:hypothetical protein